MLAEVDSHKKVKKKKKRKESKKQVKRQPDKIKAKVAKKVIAEPPRLISEACYTKNEELQKIFLRVDLFRSLLPACLTIAKRVSRVTARRIGYHAMHQLCESVLNIKLAQQNGIEATRATHNLFQKSQEASIQIPEEIKSLYHASFWTRYPFEQREGFTNIRFGQQQIPAVLEDIVNCSSGNRLFSRIANGLKGKIKKILRDVLKIDRVPSHKPITAKIDQKDRFEPDTVFSELALCLSEAPSEPLWQQWIADLKDVQTSLLELCKTKDAGEYLLLFNHLSWSLLGTVEAPLRLLHEKRLGQSTRSHNIVNLLKELDVDSLNPFLGLSKECFNQLSLTLRYPYRFDENQSSLHRLQRQVIDQAMNPMTNCMDATHLHETLELVASVGEFVQALAKETL